MARDHPGHEARRDQLADALAGHGGVIGDYRQVADAARDDGVDHPFRSAHGHEAADHQAGTIGDQFGCCLGFQRAFHAASLAPMAARAARAITSSSFVGMTMTVVRARSDEITRSFAAFLP